MKRKTPTSKRLLYWAIAQFMAVAACAIVADFVGTSGTIYTYLIPGSAAFVTLTATGYLRKSRAENTTGGIVYDTVMKE
jgi:hypothetical protein